jgi:hypothetical protein
MASFFTTVSRIGQLAGGLDVAQKTKAKEIATKNEQIRQFNLGLAKDYAIANARETGLNYRADIANRLTTNQNNIANSQWGKTFNQNNRNTLNEFNRNVQKDKQNQSNWINTYNQNKYQFDKDYNQKNSIAIARESGLNTRNFNNNLTTIGAAKIKAGASGGLSLSDGKDLSTVIDSTIASSNLLGSDAFKNGEIKQSYFGALGNLKQIITERIISKGLKDDLGGIQRIITSTISDLSPIIGSADEKGLTFGNTQIAQDIAGFKDEYNKLKKPDERMNFLKNLRQDISIKFGSITFADRMIALIQQGN